MDICGDYYQDGSFNYASNVEVFGDTCNPSCQNQSCLQ
ncbi:unnamed protein product, partial [Allacma fusca]